MKTRISTWITALSLLTLPAAPVRAVAQQEQQEPEHFHHYTVTDLGTLGGTYSEPYFLSHNGLISGTATLANGTQHAVLWFEGLKVDIGEPGLGGPNSIAFANNDRGQATGEAETSIPDPKGEDFCGFGTHLGCRAFLWQDEVMYPLPTLGGGNSQANMMNSAGLVVGAAENASPDKACPAPQVLHFKPFLWENGQTKALPTFHSDPDGVAFGINNKGAAVGSSGYCIAFSQYTLTNLQALHALLWEKGTVTDLGNLRGTGHGMGNVAYNLNDRDQVVGFSDLPGDQYFHAFLWTRETGMQDLGTLPGDVSSLAVGINERGDVVGLSLDASHNPTAFLRKNGVMRDLNTLIPANSPLFLMQACSITSRGEIVGLAMQKNTGDVHAYLATPQDSDHDALAEPGESGDNAKATLPENVHELLQQRLRSGGFSPRPMGPQ